MSIDVLEQKLDAIVAWHDAEIRRIRDEMARRLDDAMEDATGVPLHLVKASVAHMLKRMEQNNEKLSHPEPANANRTPVSRSYTPGTKRSRLRQSQ